MKIEVGLSTLSVVREIDFLNKIYAREDGLKGSLEP